jgi:hypothetical protein
MLRRLLSGLLATLALLALVAPAAGADEPAPRGLAGSFTLQGTNGYEVKAWISSLGEGDLGQLVLFVGRKREQAIYVVKGTVTREAVDFDLGPLGEVDAAVRPSGRQESINSQCGGGGKKQTFEGEEYVGTLAFHGEEGFTEAEATQVPLRLAPALTELVCGPMTVPGNQGGDGVPGAGLSIKRPRTASLRLTQNHPGAAVSYAAHMTEKEGSVRVERNVGGYLRGGAMTYAPSLETAHFNGGAPFSGSASYAKAHWRGNLTVDFPGHADVPLTGPGFKASIYAVHRDKPHTVEPN